MKALVLLSGGIDSPVAAYSMAEAGAEVHAVHMDNVPFCDASKPVEKIVAQLREITGQEIPLWVAPHGEINLSQIAQTKNPHIRCILCKRFMQRVGEALAKQENYHVLVMGDSLGQVASQTLRNIMVEEEAVQIPILRPLIGLDKQEIIKIAKFIGTYELSIENAGECGIVPEKPSTRASLEKIKEAEAEMDVEAMVTKCLDSIERL
jgi:thiamine biosynthesis protein ThiI